MAVCSTWSCVCRKLEITHPQQWDLSTGQVRVGKYLQCHDT